MKPRRFDVRMPISLTDKMHTDLAKLSADSGVTIAAIIREAVDHLIKNVRSRQKSSSTTATSSA